MDLTDILEREAAPGDLKALLLDVFAAQENMIVAQQEALMRLLHENVEQENMINVMMQEHID